MLYTHLATCFGWSWEYIDDHMTFDRLKDMRAYWRINPPLHELVAAYMGYMPPDSRTKEQQAHDNCAALVASLGVHYE